MTKMTHCKTCSAELTNRERKHTVRMCTKCINRALDGMAAADAAYTKKHASRK